MDNVIFKKTSALNLHFIFSKSNHIPDQLIKQHAFLPQEIETQRDIVRKAYKKDSTPQEAINYERQFEILSYMNCMNNHIRECNERGRDTSLNSNFITWF